MLLHNKVFVGNSCGVNIPKGKRKDFESFHYKEMSNNSADTIQYKHIIHKRVCVIYVYTYVIHIIHGTPIDLYILNILY